MKTTGLTIQEAINSGSDFKRKGWVNYIKKNTISSTTFFLDDLLAQDWELKCNEVLITRAMLADAWDKYCAGQTGLNVHSSSPSFANLVKALNL